MKLSQWSWLLGIQSYVILGVLRRSEFLVGETPALILFLLSLLSAVTGIVFGAVSWKRQEVKAWWAIGSIALNIVMALAGVNFVWAS